MSVEELASENMSRIMDWTYQSIQRGRRGNTMVGIDQDVTEAMLQRDGLLPQQVRNHEGEP